MNNRWQNANEKQVVVAFRKAIVTLLTPGPNRGEGRYEVSRSTIATDLRSYGWGWSKHVLETYLNDMVDDGLIVRRDVWSGSNLRAVQYSLPQLNGLYLGQSVMIAEPGLKAKRASVSSLATQDGLLVSIRFTIDSFRDVTLTPAQAERWMDGAK